MNYLIASAVTVWVLGIVIFTGLFAFAVYKIGGFQAYADAGNELAGRNKYTSTRVQWGLVFLTVFWPVSIYLLAKKVRPKS